LHRIDETRRALRLGLDAAVEPDRTVERCFLLHQEMAQFRFERVGFFHGGKVTAFPTPARNGVDNASHQLSYAGLASTAIRRAPEILRYDNVGRHHRPRDRHLNVRVLEDHFAFLVRDGRLALFPLDLVKGMNTRFGKDSPEVQEPLLFLLLYFDWGHRSRLAGSLSH
jgi:hypothetical protein